MLRQLGTIAVTLLCSACALLQPAPTPTPPDPQQHEAALHALRCWQLAAKIGVRTYTEAESARVDWLQFDHQYTMTISGPLGVGAVRLQGDDQRVVMHTEPNRMLVARSPEALIREELGWELPVSNLYYWIRGLAVPNHPVEASLRDPDGLLIRLEQDGWLLEIDRHAPVDGLFLPERLRLTHPDLTARLIIKEWTPKGCGS